MKRFVRLTLTVFLLLAPFVVLVRLVGRARSGGPVESFFLNSDGTSCPAPCALGIRPGATTAEQLAGVLDAHPLAINMRPMLALKNTLLFIADGNAMSLAFSAASSGEVDYIRLSFLERAEARKTGAPTLGDIIHLFGTPNYVICCSKPGLILVFLDAGLEVFVQKREPTEDRLAPDYSLSDFVVFHLDDCPPSSQEASTFSWNGFTAIPSYSQTSRARIFYDGTNRLYPIVCKASPPST